MINVESEIFTRIDIALRSEFTGIFVTGEIVAAPPKFPCVSIIEQDNATYARTLTQSLQENHAILMYQIDVFSNKTSGKKSECRAIWAVIDNTMHDLGFTRLFLNPTPNLEDSSIYRMTGRYQAVVSKNKVIYRR